MQDQKTRVNPVKINLSIINVNGISLKALKFSLSFYKMEPREVLRFLNAAFCRLQAQCTSPCPTPYAPGYQPDTSQLWMSPSECQCSTENGVIFYTSVLLGQHRKQKSLPSSALSFFSHILVSILLCIFSSLSHPPTVKISTLLPPALFLQYLRTIFYSSQTPPQTLSPPSLNPNIFLTGGISGRVSRKKKNAFLII